LFEQLVVSTDQVIGRRLAGRIGRAGRIRGGLEEQVVDAVQVAVHLIGGDMVETKRFALGGRQCLPVGAGGLEQAVGADNVGLDEIRRAIDGAIDVGLGRQMHDRLGCEALEHGADARLVGDIGLHELVAGVVGDGGQGLEIAGIGEFVEVEHFVFGVADQVAHDGRPDEAGTACNQNSHVIAFFLS
jgi:hypothetical protein